MPGYPSPPKRSTTRSAFKWIGIGVGLLFALGMCGAILSNGAPSAPTPPVISAAPAASESQATTVAAQPGPASSFDDGGYEVGADIVSGKYRSNGDTGFCWGQVRSGVDKEFNIAKDELISGEGRQTVTLKVGQYIETQGCGTWSKVG